MKYLFGTAKAGQFFSLALALGGNLFWALWWLGFFSVMELLIIRKMCKDLSADRDRAFREAIEEHDRK